MKTTLRFIGGLLALLSAAPLPAQVPVIQSLEPQHELQWSGGQSNRAAAVEISTNLATADWTTLKYDLATNGLRRVSLPTNTVPAAFYRMKVINTPPDPSLVLHFTFENDMGIVNGVTNWVMIDSSGYNNHGWSYPLAGTNIHRWPSVTNGPDGSQAASFSMYVDGYGKYNNSGDWVAIPLSSSFARLTNATIMVWAWYYKGPVIGTNKPLVAVDQATIFNAYYQGAPWSWDLGRKYSSYTKFTVLDGNRDDINAISFPDITTATDGDSGGWNHYAITFEGGLIKGFYNGQDLGQSYTLATNVLLASRYYAALGCWNFGRAPASGGFEDGYPNTGWMYGAIDDVRIYNRVLSAQEIANIYYSFDRENPSTPTNFTATSVTSTEASFTWSPATDHFGVSGYHLLRNGALVADVAVTNAIDSTVTSGASYEYSVQAYDHAGNISPATPGIPVQIP
ncbi:MAG TPA: LamG-like jellyroll fold domain-containing protein [Verrucomicrobiae bacterium]|nr:LamG-like jellyroll fold domain-containing protein [Verrucomicrobiae bacterium]